MGGDGTGDDAASAGRDGVRSARISGGGRVHAGGSESGSGDTGTRKDGDPEDGSSDARGPGTGGPSAGSADAGSSGPGSTASETLVTLGRITAHHGLNGWLKVHSDTDPRENITAYARWWIRRGGERWRTIDVLDGRAQGKTIVARLAGVEDRDGAAPLIGSEIAVRRADLPPARPDEHYWTDLVGLTVRRVEGERLGTVSRLFETGANDVVVVADERPGAKPGTEILIPWVRPDVVTAVDLAAGTVTVDWDPDY